mgnify:CR=1 FL=1
MNGTYQIPVAHIICAIAILITFYAVVIIILVKFQTRYENDK